MLNIVLNKREKIPPPKKKKSEAANRKKGFYPNRNPNMQEVGFSFV